MVFLTQFRTYLFLVAPFGFLLHCVILFQTNILVDKSCNNLLDNYSIKTHITRDISLLAFASYGIYSHSKTIVSRFISYEKNQEQ